MSRLWLASGSPRRRTLLEWCGFAVEAHPPEVDESAQPDELPVDLAPRLARLKVATAPRGVVAVAGDTVVHRDGVLFDKPADRGEATRILRGLSDGWHQVTTGFAVRRGEHLHVDRVTTDVRFRALSEDEIAAYLATGEADDKAGAYGIQGRAAAFVAEVRGSWTNVVGLPLEAVLPHIRALT